MTIHEAYKAMLAGHKVAHEAYDEYEFNYMEGDQIKDENGYYWGLKGDIAWHEKEEADWAQEGWFVCDERPIINPRTKQPIIIPKYVDAYVKEKLAKHAINSGNNFILQKI